MTIDFPLNFLLDVNECEDHTDNCSTLAKCTNADGSYNCTCNTGYSGTGFDCEGRRIEKLSLSLSNAMMHIDIDECHLKVTICGVLATCYNTPGSYNCTCDSGYTGDGVVCEGTTNANSSNIKLIFLSRC